MYFKEDAKHRAFAILRGFARSDIIRQLYLHVSEYGPKFDDTKPREKDLRSKFSMWKGAVEILGSLGPLSFTVPQLNSFLIDYTEIFSGKTMREAAKFEGYRTIFKMMDVLPMNQARWQYDMTTTYKIWYTSPDILGTMEPPTPFPKQDDTHLVSIDKTEDGLVRISFHFSNSFEWFGHAKGDEKAARDSLIFGDSDDEYSDDEDYMMDRDLKSILGRTTHTVMDFQELAIRFITRWSKNGGKYKWMPTSEMSITTAYETVTIKDHSTANPKIDELPIYFTQNVKLKDLKHNSRKSRDPLAYTIFCYYDPKTPPLSTWRDIFLNLMLGSKYTQLLSRVGQGYGSDKMDRYVTNYPRMGSSKYSINDHQVIMPITSMTLLSTLNFKKPEKQGFMRPLFYLIALGVANKKAFYTRIYGAGNSRARRGFFGRRKRQPYTIMTFGRPDKIYASRMFMGKKVFGYDIGMTNPMYNDKWTQFCKNATFFSNYKGFGRLLWVIDMNVETGEVRDYGPPPGLILKEDEIIEVHKELEPPTLSPLTPFQVVTQKIS